MSLYKQARSLPKRFRLVLALQNAGDGSQGDVDPGAPGLAYNPIRQTMLQAARKAGMSPRALRFAAAVQSIAASWLVIVLRDDALARRLINAALGPRQEQLHIIEGASV